jgi:uncharacterized damage-inducible protein DinB
MARISEMNILLQAIEEGYSEKAWHGTNLRGSIRGLTAKEAAKRPGKGRHNIWEVVVHCAYWKYIVRRRILNEKKGSFPLEGSNWFTRPVGTPNENDWRRDIGLLDKIHKEMVDAVKEIKSSDLNRKPGGSKVSNRAIITGIAMHDVYHAGQIQLIKRML